MQEKIHPAPVWLENDADFKDIRIDLYVDPSDDSGEQDLTVRFSFPKDGSAPYMMLVLGGADLGEVVLAPHHAAQVEARLDKALALFQPYYDGERAFPADLEAALESGVARVQDLVDADAKLRALPLDANPLTRVEALLPYGEAVKTLEDWAVAAANLLPDEPAGAAALDFEAPDLRLERGDVAVTLEWIGEGADGDYDPTDPGDEPLMRIGVERRANGEWEAVDDASYCTNISARASQKGMILAMQYVLEQVPAEGSVKRLMERMSWIELTTQDGDSPDFSRVPA